MKVYLIQAAVIILGFHYCIFFGSMENFAYALYVINDGAALLNVDKDKQWQSQLHELESILESLIKQSKVLEDQTIKEKNRLKELDNETASILKNLQELITILYDYNNDKVSVKKIQLGVIKKELDELNKKLNNR